MGDGVPVLGPCASPYMSPLGTHSIHVTGEALKENVGDHVFRESGRVLDKKSVLTLDYDTFVSGECR